MNESDTTRDETTIPVVAVGSRARSSAVRPELEAMRCLREARVRFALVNGDPEALLPQPGVDVLIEPGEMEIAAASLRRAGYREMHHTARGRGRTTFLTYEGDCFVAITLHEDLALHGVRCLDTGLAFARRDVHAAIPRLAKEDRFLYLLLGAALAGRAPNDDERTQLVRLRRDHLDVARLAEQTRPLGIKALVDQALAELDVLLRQNWRWRRFCLALGLALWRQPGVRGDLWRRARAAAGRGGRPVLIAVVGPPHAGKTALASTLESQLALSPLAARRLSMSCWQGGGLWDRCLRALAPGALSLPRMWRVRRGQRVRLTEVEREAWLAQRPSWASLAVGAALQPAQSAVFHALLLATMRWRYARHIAASRQPIVLADGWVLDLAFRSGRDPYQHGERWRRFFMRHFPAPDGIVYLSPSYELAASRATQLTREQFDGVDLALRKILRPLSPLEFVTDDAPRVVALTFLNRYWAHLLERHNRHA